MSLILIVDDDPDMAELLGHMCDILGHRHKFVLTGGEAMAFCRSNRPDTIILDVMAEETDGWTIYRQLEPLTTAPIVFISAWRTGANRRQAEALRADGFLAKPISHQEFARQIQTVIGAPARRLRQPVA